MTPNPRKKRQYPFKRNVTRKMRRIVFMLIAAALASGVNYYQSHKSSTATNNDTYENNHSSSKNSSAHYFTDKQQQQAVKKLKAAKNKTSAQFWVGFNAKIVQNLKDDLSGSRHQKFIVSPSDGITLLISHNIDLAKRVPAYKGESISIYGRYEWNNRGGVVHWTHHDPKGKKAGGWIRHNKKVYR